MDIIIYPRKLYGTVTATSSKSHIHRLLIASSLADYPTRIICNNFCRDVDATVTCLNRIGANLERTEYGYFVKPIEEPAISTDLPCGESGSTLRFLLPIIGALGIRGTFYMEGNLPQRPLSPLWEEMQRMGCTLSRPSRSTILCEGKLRPGIYTIAGNVSSQFISGLLFAHSLMPLESELKIKEPIESYPYIEMTKSVLSLFGNKLHSPGSISAEGDWSNSAFFFAANSFGCKIEVSGLNPNSVQGDRICVDLIKDLTNYVSINAADVPDLVPILAIVAAAHNGAEFTQIQRLSTKESDRIKTIVSMINSLGGNAFATDSTIKVQGTGLSGGIINSFNDHRIAMSAAIASTVCQKPVIILGAECVNKSCPEFWNVFTQLGGYYEQYLR